MISLRRSAKLKKRIIARASPSTLSCLSASPCPSPSPSPTVPSRSPSPLVLPSLLQLELGHQAQRNAQFEPAGLQRPLLYKPLHQPQTFERLLDGGPQRQLIESQLHSTLGEITEAAPSTDSSRQRLESQARDILRSLDHLPSRPSPCPQHTDKASGLARNTETGDRIVVHDNSIETVENRRDNDNNNMLKLGSSRVSHARLPATIHQGRFNTLLRKASRLCEIAEADIYMSIRINGRFYVYNSADPTSQMALQPEAHEKVINVSVTSSVGVPEPKGRKGYRRE